MAVNLGQQDAGKDSGIQRVKLPVYEFYSGSGDHTENFPYVMKELVFSNDSTGTITVQVLSPAPASLNISFVLLKGEVLDERLPDFTQVVISASGLAWRFYTRMGLIA